MEDGETVRISANFALEPSSTLHRLLGRNITKGWLSSDHVFVSVPSLGRKHILQAHPFTIISPAPKADDKDAKLDLLIRAQRGFSFDLLREAMERTSLTIRIDELYGSHHARALLQDSDLTLLVAGGSGIAVAWPLVNFLIDQNSSQKIILIWVIHRGSRLSWLGWPALQEAGRKGVQVIVPPATEEVGRPDLHALTRSLVMDEGSGKRVAVVGSGPDSMGRAVRNTCAGMVRDGWDVGVTIEKFGW
jgi:NAD(P)H-flavin reductase